MNALNEISNPKSQIPNPILHPVILSVPKKVSDLKPRDRVTFLSKQARKALARSAEKSGICGLETNKDEKGIPLPFNGTYWSVTHKTEYVGGVVSPRPIGIDIEKIQPCSEGLFKKTATEAEWSLVDRVKNDFTPFYRYWTSKEAVLKTVTTGIKDLLKCRIQQITDDHHLVITYQKTSWYIEHYFFDDHIASIVQNNFTIEWTIC